MKECRDCKHQVSEDALGCPSCGAPFPARVVWTGWGFEYKSRTAFGSWPLLHISFKFKPNRLPVPARGIIAIGQVGVGVITVAQFGLGVIGVAQFAVGGYILAQFAIAYSLVAQFGLYIHEGYGQFVQNAVDLLGRL